MLNLKTQNSIQRFKKKFRCNTREAVEVFMTYFLVKLHELHSMSASVRNSFEVPMDLKVNLPNRAVCQTYELCIVHDDEYEGMAEYCEKVEGVLELNRVCEEGHVYSLNANGVSKYAHLEHHPDILDILYGAVGS